MWLMVNTILILSFFTLSTSAAELKISNYDKPTMQRYFIHNGFIITQDINGEPSPKEIGGGVIGAAVATYAIYIFGLKLTQCHKKEPIDPLNCFYPATVALAIGIPIGGKFGMSIVSERKITGFTFNALF